MKQSSFLQLILAFAGTYLLYQTGWGLNVVLLSIIVLSVLLYLRRISLLPALLFGAAGILVGIYGSVLISVLYVLMLLLLISQAHNKFSWPIAYLDGIKQILTAGWLKLRQSGSPIPGMSLSKGLLLTLPPAGISLIFYAMYANANPVFADKVSLAQLPAPDLSWCLLFIGLLYTSFALVHPQPAASLQKIDLSKTDELIRQRSKSFFNPFWLKYEYKTALLALGMLNIMLLLFHGVDAGTLATGQPGSGVSYAEWVHQGVGALIISIVLAVALLLYVFRGNLNFFQQNKPLKLLAKSWIVQNMLLVITTALKNSWYIAYYGLTHKRIGVVVYLVLVLIGLFSCWQKINYKKTFWWIFRSNLKAAVLVLLLTASFPWTRMITWHNLEKAQIQDTAYLLELPLHNTDQLAQYQHLLSNHERRRLQIRQEQLLNSTQTFNWKNWTLINHYAAYQLEYAK